MHKISLLIFAKPPRMGLSKTRLAEGVGPTQARRIAGFTLASTLRAARASGLDAKVYTTPDLLAGGQQGRALFRGLEVHPQGAGTLTDRLERGLRDAQPGMVLFVGSDAPDVSPALLRAAVRGLGVARMARSVGDTEVAAGRLVRVLPDFELTALRVYALMPARKLVPRKVRVFLDALEAEGASATPAPA
jgi:DNA-binding transcriptional LysR family regulator